jgi:anti-sigma B factor antagonist
LRLHLRAAPLTVFIFRAAQVLYKLRGQMIMRKIARLSRPYYLFQRCFWLFFCHIFLPVFFSAGIFLRVIFCRRFSVGFFLEDSEVANPFAIQTSIGNGENDLSIVALEGFVDAHTAPQFEDAIQKAVDTGSVRIVVNCEKLNYISSAGLGVFMSFIEEVRDRGGDIKICGLTPKVRHTFEILGFQDIFEMLDDQQTAVQRFNA